MKRYRVLGVAFDFGPNVLKIEIKDDWDEKVKKLWKENKKSKEDEIIAQFGILDAPMKIKRYLEIGESPISIIAFHNKFLRQIREAYVTGSYYPALTAACALGERVLNQLIIHLRDEFKHTEVYKKLYRKKSFDDWDFALDVLEEWKVLLPEVMQDYRDLKELRNRKAIHFNPETDTNDKELALRAITLLQNVVKGQFSGFGTQPWFIPEIGGAAFIKKEYEDDPFVKHIILPNCKLVGPAHRLERSLDGWIVIDDSDYEEKEITDEEFAELFEKSKQS